MTDQMCSFSDIALRKYKDYKKLYIILYKILSISWYFHASQFQNPKISRQDEFLFKKGPHPE